METTSSNRRLLGIMPWVGLAAIVALYHLLGNTVRGYIDTGSTFVWWIKQWFIDNAETEHGPLVLLLAGWFFWTEWKRPASSSASSGLSRRMKLTAGVVIFLALGLHLVGLLAQQTRISIVSFLALIWGWSWWTGGAKAGKAAFFPLVLMLFSMNLEFITGELSTFLRSNVSLITEKLSNLLGLGVLRNGSQLTSVDGLFHYDVAPGCSGIRSLVALIVLSLVIGKLTFSGWKRTMLLGLLALPFAFAGNVARIFGIVLAGRWFGQDAGVTFHDYSGFVVFVVVLGLAVLSSKLLQKFTPAISAAPPENGAQASTDGIIKHSSPVSTGCWVFLFASVFLAAVLSAWTIQLAPSPSAGIRLDTEGKPMKLPDYLVTLSGKDLYPSKDELEVLPKDTGFAYKQYVSLRDPRDVLQVMLVLSGKDRSSIHKPEVCLPGQGWDIKSGETRSISIPQLETESLPVTLLKISRSEQLPDGSKREVKALFSYWFVGAEDVVATHEQRQWLTAINRLFRFRFDRWAYVSVTAPINRPGDAGEEAAWQRIQDFAQRAVPKFQTAGLKK